MVWSTKRAETDISKWTLGAGYGGDEDQEERGLVGHKLWSIRKASVRVSLTKAYI